MFHIRTLSHFKGITEQDSSLPPLDGFNIWHTISEGAPSPRTEILHNIDSLQGIAIRVDGMKLLTNIPNLTWYKPPELSPEYHQFNFVPRALRENPSVGGCRQMEQVQCS